VTARLSPYVCLAGTAREALDFYRSVLGGEVRVSTFAEFGGGGEGVDPDAVMHGQLDTPDGFTLMVSDAMPGMVASGSGGVALCLSGDDAEHLRACFAGLAEGGEVTTPLEAQVWGDEYGALTDRFGVDWMVNVSTSPVPSVPA
jgi:PhnB protein